MVSYFQEESAINEVMDKSEEREKCTVWFIVNIKYKLLFLFVLYYVISAIHKFCNLTLFLIYYSFNFNTFTEHQLHAKSPQGVYDTQVNRTNKNPCFQEPCIPVGEDWQ